MRAFIFLIELGKVIMMNAEYEISEQNKMRLKDESLKKSQNEETRKEMSMIGMQFINKVDMLTQVLRSINMAVAHVQGAVHSHSNAGIAAQGRLNRGVRNCDSEL